MRTGSIAAGIGILVLVFGTVPTFGMSDAYKDNLYVPGHLKPTDSMLRVAVGEPAPDFTLPSVHHGMVSLKSYRGKKNVVVSFIPAAWTPVCSDQWPGYNIVQDIFDRHDAALVGISTDNIPTLFAWTRQMGTLWFPVLSDFWPHGTTAAAYGVLRSNGTAERAIFVIDKKGIIRAIDVHDINVRPPLESIIKELEKLDR